MPVAVKLAVGALALWGTVYAFAALAGDFAVVSAVREAPAGMEVFVIHLHAFAAQRRDLLHPLRHQRAIQTAAFVRQQRAANLHHPTSGSTELFAGLHRAGTAGEEREKARK